MFDTGVRAAESGAEMLPCVLARLSNGVGQRVEVSLHFVFFRLVRINLCRVATVRETLINPDGTFEQLFDRVLS